MRGLTNAGVAQQFSINARSIVTEMSCPQMVRVRSRLWSLSLSQLLILNVFCIRFVDYCLRLDVSSA